MARDASQNSPGFAYGVLNCEPLYDCEQLRQRKEGKNRICIQILPRGQCHMVAMQQ